MSQDSAPSFGSGFPLHAASLGLLLALTVLAWRALGAPHPTAFWVAVALPVLHQVFVWIAWRAELRSRATSETIGFGAYLAIFFVLFGGRFVALAWLSWLDRGSLGLSVAQQLSLGGLAAAPAVYAGYSVARYFGPVRAAGADHFDPRYRTMPLVREGIFRFTSNGMYVYAFLAFWAIALACGSGAGLLVAAFSHAYIWVHYFCTERPDMRFLYGEA